MKKLIRKWLGIDKIEKENRRLKGLFHNYLEVSADISPSQKGMSWAIVHLKGKPEVLRFYGGNHYEIKEIAHFLRQFSRENRLIDAPIQLKSFLEDIR